VTLNKEPIIATVLRILDEYTILIDAGYKRGVVKGMKFVVFSEGDYVFGLDGTNLGKLEYPKATVEVIHVQQNFSMAESATIVEYSPADEIAEALTYSRVKELPVSKESIKKIPDFDKTVHVGDKVRQIVGELPTQS
jgi:hypothetical protein